MKRTLLLAAALASLGWIATARAADPAPDPRLARAKAAAESLRDQLLATVQGAMSTSGPAASLSVCRLAAPALTTAAERPDLKIGRTASRLRNPDNAPRPWVAPLLQQLEKQAPAERRPLTTTLPDGSLGVVLPIVMGKPCLACHGVDVAADVRAALAVAYPKDAALGFREGDLRGAFWVEAR